MSISSADRITIGSIRHPSAREPANVENPAWIPALTQIIATKRPITIDGTPVITWVMNRITEAKRPFPPYSCR